MTLFLGWISELLKLLNAQHKVAKLKTVSCQAKNISHRKIEILFFYQYFLKCKRSSNRCESSEERNSSQSFTSFSTYI